MKLMNRILIPVLALVAFVSLGCPKKAPKAAPVSAPEAAPLEVTPRPEAPPEQDAVANPLDADLAAANLYAQQQGLLADVYFEFDKAELRSEARERLAKNARFLSERPEFQVTVEGHCDERGTNEYNLALGQSRATMARNYLVSLGIAPERLVVVSLGEERPACGLNEESCWAQNRRAHFLLTGRVPSSH